MTRDIESLHPSEALKLLELFNLDEHELRERYRAYETEINKVGLSSEDIFVNYILDLRNWHEKMTAILTKLYVLLHDKYAQKSGLDFKPDLAEIESLLRQLEGKEPVHNFKQRLKQLLAQLSVNRL